MVSRLTIPDARRASTRIASAASLAGALWLILASAGCPLRDKEIRITDTGIGWLTKACQLAGGPFPPFGGGGSSGPGGSGGSGGAGFSGPPPPTGPGSDPQRPCGLEGHYLPNLYGRSTEARLFLVSPGDGRVQDASKCMRLHPCLDGGRSGPTADCMAADINQQLDGAMPNGLGFDGLKNAEEAQLILAFYQPANTSEEAGGCHRIDLFACAGLAAPLGGGAHDISCASCQGGSRTANGSDTGPCPRDQSQTNSCFLQICDGLLSDNGFD
ncbi:MAG TPA: hypothetical protein VK540_06395 [Polyangiaceae bacterium]|jgi:hypothetical protein|nr:hypothetical protein [Polyangiaceae bacterium]